MFEKEAEEWINREYDNSYYPDCNFSARQDAKTAFKGGAEFGYNKANEWHKPSEKLPEECSLVLAYAFDSTEPELYEFVASDTWEYMPRRIAFLSNSQIRLWQEITPPKENE